jgi:hypothetical protein
MSVPQQSTFSASAARVSAVCGVKNAVTRLMMTKPNVHAVGVGFKNPYRQGKGEVCVVVAVSRKLPKDALSRSDLIPKTMDGVKTDVVELPLFRSLQAVAGTARAGEASSNANIQRLRPTRPGCSIGHLDTTAGTFGCVVRRDGMKFILSNNHVLANNNQARLGDAILQPGPLDGGTLNNDRLATLVEFVPLAFEGEPEPPAPPTGCGNFWRNAGAPAQPINTTGRNRVDCALARVDATMAGGDDNLSAEILNIGMPAGVAEAALGMQVQKSGRTTGYTVGEIEQVDVSSKVEYEGRDAIFTGQLLAGGMSASGDSGSAVLDMNRNVVGLLFAGSNVATLINPIQEVLTALRVELVIV